MIETRNPAFETSLDLGRGAEPLILQAVMLSAFGGASDRLGQGLSRSRRLQKVRAASWRRSMAAGTRVLAVADSVADAPRAYVTFSELALQLMCS